MQCSIHATPSLTPQSTSAIATHTPPLRKDCVADKIILHETGVATKEGLHRCGPFVLEQSQARGQDLRTESALQNNMCFDIFAWTACEPEVWEIYFINCCVLGTKVSSEFHSLLVATAGQIAANPDRSVLLVPGALLRMG